MDLTNLGYKHILCPVDFSEGSRRAFYVAVAYARHFETQLTILHVSEGMGPSAGFNEVEAEHERLERLEAGLKRRLNELQADGAVSDSDRELMTLEIAGGKPWVEIVRYADEHDVDLIVMGTHGHSGLLHALIGSQAERVVRRAGCDVLTVKPDGFKAQLP